MRKIIEYLKNIINNKWRLVVLVVCLVLAIINFIPGFGLDVANWLDVGISTLSGLGFVFLFVVELIKK